MEGNVVKVNPNSPIPKVPEVSVQTSSVAISSLDSTPKSIDLVHQLPNDINSTLKYFDKCTQQLIVNNEDMPAVDESMATPNSQTLPSLISLIGSDLVSSIHELNQQMKDSSTITSRINLGNSGNCQSINLYFIYFVSGWFDERCKRTEIHFALKREFPLLQSTTIKSKVSI